MPPPAKPHWHKGRKVWYANIGKPDAKGRATEVYAPSSIDRRDEASAWKWFEEEKGRQRAETKPLDRQTITVKQVIENYLRWGEQRLNEGRLSAQHYLNKKYHVGLFEDELGSRAASGLTTGNMNDFVSKISGAYSANYTANICATVSAMFNWAATTGALLDTNPIKGFDSPTVPRSPERFAERAEAAAFVKYWLRRNDRTSPAGRYDRLTLLLDRCLIHSGARPGELCNLWWSDMRWTAGMSSAGHPFAKATIPPDRHKTGVKTGKPRQIYFTPILTRSLRREQARALHEKYVFVHGRGRGGIGEGQRWADGSRLSAKIRVIRRELIARQEEIREQIKAGKEVPAWDKRMAGVPVLDEGHNRLTNYRWRHTAISTLLMLGVDVPTVAELTGTSPEMIYRIYGHLLDRHLRLAAEKLSRPQSRTPVLRNPNDAVG